MSAEQGKVLLPIARAAISRALGIPAPLSNSLPQAGERTNEKSNIQSSDETAPWLAEPGACFVTLTRQGELRGCIGTLQAHRSLLDDVRSNAVSAALRDSRFTPLSATELDNTRIEISLLSPPQTMNFRNEGDALTQLRPHVDGVIFQCGQHRSTFLPQVWEQLPQPLRFMAHLKQKAGLPADFWSQEVKLSRYTVEKWKE